MSLEVIKLHDMWSTKYYKYYKFNRPKNFFLFLEVKVFFRRAVY